MLIDDWFYELLIDQIVNDTDDVLRNESIQRTLIPSMKKNDVCKLKLVID